MADLTPYQKDILIKTALGEARGEGVEGMADVIQVILNRANSGQFPSDPAAVALQNKQFSAWNSGAGGNNPGQFKPGTKSYQTAAQALEAVMSGSRPDPTGGALYYHTPSVSPQWASAVNTNGTVERNGHVFYPSRPVPPGDIPSVGTLLDTRRSAPTPAIPSIAAAQMRGNTSPSGGNTALQSALDAYATRERNRVTPMTMQGKATTVATIPTTRSLTTPGAVNASVSSTRQDPALAAALARKLNPVSASDLTRGSPTQTRNVSTTVASFPTAPAKLPSIPASTIGSSPTTIVVPTTRVTPSASDMARGRSLPAVTTLPKATVPLTIGAQSSFAGQDRAMPISQARLPASPAGLPALYGTMSQNRVNSIGLPLSTSVAPTSGFRVTASSPTPLTRPGVFSGPQAAPVVSQRTAPTPAAKPVFAARVPAPVAAPVVRQPLAQPVQRSPLNVLVQGANIVQPPPMTPVQALQAQGLSPSQAYAAANARNNQQTVYDRVRGERDSGGSGGVQPRGTIW